MAGPSAMAAGDGTARGGAGDAAHGGARRAALEQLARKAGVVRVRGASMVPTLADTSWVRFNARRPRAGDVVVYRRSGGDLVVHRFLGRRPRWWQPGDPAPSDPWIVTKPDAAAEFDVETRLSAVLGTVDEFRVGDTAPWQRLSVTPWRRVCSMMWFVRYVLRRVRRRWMR